MADNYEFFPNKKAKSDIWGHFWVKCKKETKEIAEGVAVCRHCDAVVKNTGGTSNLTSHMNRHHSSLLGKRKNLNSTPLSTSSTCIPNAKAVSLSQPTLSGMFASPYTFKSDRASAITKSVGQYIIHDMRPFSVIEGKGIRNMLRTLEPRYTLPSRTYFTQTFLPKVYEECAGQVKETLSKASCVAITTDGWTSRATQSYITITSMHIDPDWKLQSFVLQTRAMPESHTGINIAAVIQDAIVEWGLPNNPPLVTDNASNMVVAARELQSKPHIGCFAHSLNLAAQNALKINEVSKLLGRVRRVVSYFHRSTTAAAMLKCKIKLLGLKDLKLIHDVPTRWNSAADMLERYLQLQSAVYATLVSKDLSSSGREPDIITLNEAQTRLAEDIMECLLPLRSITQAVCTERTPTVTIILPLLQKINHIMAAKDGDSLVKKQIKEAVTRNLATRYNSVEIREFLEECTVLDPRFKDTFFDPVKIHEVYERIQNLCLIVGGEVLVKPEPDQSTTEHSAEPSLSSLPSLPALDMVEDEPKPDTTDTHKVHSGGLASIFDDVKIVRVEKGKMTLFERVEKELSAYKDASQIPLNEDPLLWWKEHTYLFPNISILVRKRLCIPATSVPSERVFSTAGDIVTAQRAALEYETVDRLIFLKKNCPL